MSCLTDVDGILIIGFKSISEILITYKYREQEEQFESLMDVVAWLWA